MTPDTKAAQPPSSRVALTFWSSFGILGLVNIGGFISTLAFERVLGVPPMQRSVEFYSQQGGIFIATLVQVLLVGWSDLADGVQFLANWRGALVWLVAVSIAVALLALRVAGHYRGWAAMAHPVVAASAVVAGSLGAFALLSIQGGLLTVRNTLMPPGYSPVAASVAAAMLDDQRAGGHFEREAHLSRLAYFIESADENGGGGFERLFRFDSLDGYVNLRIAVFAVIVLMVVITLLIAGAAYAAVLWSGNARLKQATIISSLLLALGEALLLPYSHGVLGRLYRFPVGSVIPVQEAGGARPVLFLLASDENSHILYDRENYFRISLVERKQIRGFDQFSSESPFTNCSANREFRGCEIRWGLGN